MGTEEKFETFFGEMLGGSASKRLPVDGNEAAAMIAYKLSECAALFPITPATPMGEHIDRWIAEGRKNIWGHPVRLATLESEGGVAGAMHGSSAVGAITSTYTSSQGFLLMIPNLYKIAAEHTPVVVHLASRSLANGGMSIFNDHADIYSARSTGMPIIASANVQEVHDLGAVAHLTTIKTGLPFIHTFDGMRTSHEINTMTPISDDHLEKLIDYEGLFAMRRQSLNPEHPQVRGPILSEAFHWLAAEKPNERYAALPAKVDEVMRQLAELTGRRYTPFDYVGHPQAESVVILMASGCGTIEEYVRMHPEQKLGVVKVHLYRPFSSKYLLQALPPSVKRICVLDKVREFSAVREPLATDVATVLLAARYGGKFISGRYGIGNKDFNPRHAEAIFKNLRSDCPTDSFTVGLRGSETALPLGEAIDTLPKGTTQCLFWGLGSDGTVGANKDGIKLIVDNTDLYGQAYFAYSAHKSGGLTISHVRFGKEPIGASYYVQTADYIGCHNPAYCQRYDMVKDLRPGGIFVINCPEEADVEKLFPPLMKKQLGEKKARVYRIDASAIARKVGLPGRINQIMQTVFFGLAKVLPVEKVIALLKKSIEKTYVRKGREAIEQNWRMVDQALAGVHEVKYDSAKWAATVVPPEEKREGWARVLQLTMQNRGDEVSLESFPDGASVEVGTSCVEKRGIATSVPVWDAKKCVQCNLCGFLCPHQVIRPFLLKPNEVPNAPRIKARGKELAGLEFSIGVSALDCTGCGLCAASCPAGALSMSSPTSSGVKKEGETWPQLLAVENRGHLVEPSNVRNAQFREPHYEFSGACGGCGEPALIKAICQLYGDQLYLCNAAGCSVVFNSSVPFIPFTKDKKGHGPAWAFSLFEDNAQYGFGQYLGYTARRDATKTLIEETIKAGKLSGGLKSAFEKLLSVWDDVKASAAASEVVQAELAKADKTFEIRELISQQDVLAKKTAWILGGDGWAYDIGYGGLDHVLASGQNVNVLVLDTEVYSNTGGQSSKATQRGAVANFAAAGYSRKKKDLAALMMTYGNIYVAVTCHLANPEHAFKCIKEATEYNGPSIVINYSPCINHGIRAGMQTNSKHARELLDAGYLLLLRYDPRRKAAGQNPLVLDCKKPKFELSPLFKGESRFASLPDMYPAEAEKKFPLLLQDLKERWDYYEKLATAK